MAALPEIQRTISGKGEIRIPEQYTEALQIYLYTQVVRKVLTPSLNTTFNPDKSFYAHISFCIDDYVLYNLDVNFDQQAYLIHDGGVAQNLLSLICAYDGILDSFVELGISLDIVVSRINRIKNHPYNRFVPNKIKFECFASTALVLTLKGTELEKCNSADGEPVPPPPPPAPRAALPPGTPIETTPPYDDPSGGQDTQPFPIDEPEEPPSTGDPCVSYDVTYRYLRQGVEFIATIPLWGEIGNIAIDNDSTGTGSRVSIECRGISISEPCGTFRFVRVESEGNLNFYSDATIISIVASPT